MPHKRIIRNLRRLLTEVADKPAEREKHLEQLLLALPRGSAEVQRPKTEEIIPDCNEAGKDEHEKTDEQ